MKINKVEKIIRLNNNPSKSKQSNQSKKKTKTDEGKSFKDILQILDVKI